MTVTPDVEKTDPDGVDYGWVMQATFVASIVVGAPIVAVLSLFVSVPTWPDRAMFAIQVGAPIWLLLNIGMYGYARRESE